MRERALLPLLLAALLGAAEARADAAADASGGDAAAWLAARDRALAAMGAAPAPAPAELPDATLAAPAGGAPRVVGSDVRLALTQMALAAGSAGQAEIAAAQAPAGPGDPGALYLRSGSTTLAGLWEAAEAAGLGAALRREGDRYVAARPLVVVQGASLLIGPGEALDLEPGTFLLSFGRLAMDGATLRAGAPADPDALRPFVASLGTGTLDVVASTFEGLGSGASPVAGGLAVSMGSLLAARSAPPSIRDSLFVDVWGVSVIDGDGATVDNNRLERPRGVALWIRGGDGARVTGNLVVEPSGAFAARVDGPGAGATVAGNVLVDGRHAGLRVAGGARGVAVEGNVVAGFAGRGIVVEEGAGCLRLSANLVQGNGGDGVGARNAGLMVVDGNAVEGNGGAGLSLSRATDPVTVAGNRFAGNRSGVRTALVDALTLSGNDLAEQAPRHLAGDLSQHTPLFLRAVRDGGTASFAFGRATAEAVAPLAPDAPRAAFDACRTEAGS